MEQLKSQAPSTRIRFQLKTQALLLRSHVPSTRKRWKRCILFILKTLSRVEKFQNATVSDSCGRVEFTENVNFWKYIRVDGASFESRTAQMSALIHIFTCAFCLTVLPTLASPSSAVLLKVPNHLKKLEIPNGYTCLTQGMVTEGKDDQTRFPKLFQQSALKR